MERMDSEKAKEWEEQLSLPIPDDSLGDDDFSNTTIISENSTIY